MISKAPRIRRAKTLVANDYLSLLIIFLRILSLIMIRHQKLKSLKQSSISTLLATFFSSATQDYKEATVRRGCYARLLENLVYMDVQYCPRGQYSLVQRLRSWRTLKKKAVTLVADWKPVTTDRDCLLNCDRGAWII